jgi:DNA-binding NtrC family response regulator
LEGSSRPDGRRCLGTAVVAERDATARSEFKDLLTAAGLGVVECADTLQVSPALASSGAWLLVVGDLAGGEQSVLALLPQLRSLHPRVRVILCPSNGSEGLAIEAIRMGVADYLRRPLDAGHVKAALSRAQASSTTSTVAPSPAEGLNRLVGDSPSIRALRELVVRAATVESNVLITGETGTGKELVAELIHQNSARRAKPFVQVNCAAIPESLIESELFGYERGAFTGAFAAVDGKLALAQGGTVFLDEIGDLSASAQAKLLRAIEGKEIYRLGGRAPVKLDIRVVAATNRDLETDVTAGRFRADLFYRLNVVRIQTPALRDRVSDLPLLVSHFVNEFNRPFGAQVEGFGAASCEWLNLHSWPGNVRELRNLVEAAFVHLSPPGARQLEVPEPIRQRMAVLPHVTGGERERLVSALLAENWNRSKAAQRLNWSRMTVYRKMKSFGLADSTAPSPNGKPRHTAERAPAHHEARKAAAG